jgi:multidrug efflux pump subunit AcrB
MEKNWDKVIRDYLSHLKVLDILSFFVAILAVVFGLILLRDRIVPTSDQKMTNYVEQLPQQSFSNTPTNPNQPARLPTPQSGDKEDITGHAAASGASTSA